MASKVEAAKLAYEKASYRAKIRSGTAMDLARGKCKKLIAVAEKKANKEYDKAVDPMWRAYQQALREEKVDALA
jgi:hypothetical protein